MKFNLSIIIGSQNCDWQLGGMSRAAIVRCYASYLGRSLTNRAAEIWPVAGDSLARPFSSKRFPFKLGPAFCDRLSVRRIGAVDVTVGRTCGCKVLQIKTPKLNLGS